jgi:hypothetical protein
MREKRPSTILKLPNRLMVRCSRKEETVLCFEKDTACYVCDWYPCKCSEKICKDKHKKAVQKGAEFEQELDQNSFQDGSEQENEQEQNAVLVPIQEGPELDSSQDQSGNIMGPEQSNEQEQFNGQVPIQDGSEIENDQEQLVAQVPIQDGSDQDLDQDQLTAQVPIQDGSDQDLDQDQLTAQVPIQDGSDQDLDQDQLTAQVPIQDGSDQDLDQDQLTAQVPIQDGSDQDLDQDQITAQVPIQEGPDLNQTQMQDQNQEEDQFQLMGDQSQEQGMQMIEGHTNMSPLDNNQMIDTSVSGVTVNNTTNVKCGCSIDDDKEDGKHCKDKKRTSDDCCVKDIANLLNEVRITQSQIEESTDQGIDIYTDGNTSAGNPIENQVITNVNNCDTVTFRMAGQMTPIPNTTLRIKKVTGIQATDNPESDDDIFDNILSIGTTCFDRAENTIDCKKKKLCCEGAILNNLEAAQTFGLELELVIKGLDMNIENVFVLNICDCLVFLVDDLVEPSTIYVFSVCAIEGVLVPSQTLGPAPES